MSQSSIDLSRLITFKSAGSLDRVIAIQSIDALRRAVTDCQSFIVIGGGSNSVISPDVSIPILRLSPAMTPPYVTDEGAYLPAGMPLAKCLQFLAKSNRSGLEFGAGVPATIGGMIYMNFGCWGHAVSDRLIDVHVMDSEGADFWLPAEDLAFGYRTSRFHHDPLIIIGGHFRLDTCPESEIKNRIRDMITRRKASQPVNERTFGSIFRNPDGYFAAQLIEQAGLKGAICGDAQLSPHHANFMVNLGSATHRDITDLLQLTVDTVFNKFGIRLDREVCVYE